MPRKVQSGAAIPTADGYIDANGDWQPRPMVAASASSGGTVDIDQTTPGTTNGVVVNASALPTGASTSALQGGGLPAALAAGGGLKVEGVAGGVAMPVSGTFYPGTQPVSVAASQIVAGALVDGADLTQGVTTGAGVITDAAGTIQQYLRGLVKLAITAGGFLVRASVASGGVASGGIASGAVASGAVASGAVASGAVAAGALAAGSAVDGWDLTQGVTTGAAVITDATGTLQQYLRGLVKLAITAGGFLVRASVASGGIASGGIASGAVASGAVASGAIASGAVAASAIAAGAGVDGWDLTQGVTTGAAVVTDATGTIQQYLRGIVKLLVDKITVKGVGFNIATTLTVTNGAYTIGDVVGGLITMANMVSANSKHARVDTVTLSGVAAIPYDLVFFSGDVADTNIPDADPLTYAAADGLLYRGHINITAPDYCALLPAFNVATIRGCDLVIGAGATTSVYAYLKATATTSPGTATLYLRVTGEFVD